MSSEFAQLAEFAAANTSPPMHVSISAVAVLFRILRIFFSVRAD
jgi:hypothetical protein